MKFFKKLKEKSKRKRRAEIQAMADLLTTKAEYKKAGREIEKLERQIDEGRFSSLNRIIAEDHIKKLEEAMKIAERKGYEWQFVPELDLFTPIEAVELAYKRIKDKKEKERLEKKYPNTCYSLDVYDTSDSLDEKPSGFAKYKTLMKKLSDEPDIEKRAEIIDKWVKTNGTSEDFNIYSGEDYLWDVLSSSAVPRPRIFMEKGYNTVEKCSKLTEEEIKQWKGIGDKVLKQFTDFKRNYKEDID